MSKNNKKILLVIATFCLLLIINGVTGIFSKFSIKEKEHIAIEYGENSKIYERFVYELLFKTKSQYDWERRIAIAELSHLTPSPEIQNALEDLLDDESYDIRRDAAIALVKMKKPSEKIVKILTKMVQHSLYHDKYIAIQLLGSTGEYATPAIAVLKEELNKKHANHQNEIHNEIVKTLEKLNAYNN